jgi:peptidyl-prolyl cis-trans isomerase C
MSDELNLSLPKKQDKSPAKQSKLATILLFCLLVLSIVHISFAVYRSTGKKLNTDSNNLSAESIKDLALKFEKQGLQQQAADTWQEYLSQSDINQEERAKIWYRIGKLFQDDQNYELALSAYYRSESFAKVFDLEQDLNRRIQECLESSSKYAALRYELANRVGMNKNDSGAEVLAEIGTHKITKADVDRNIEEQIERQMASYATFMSEEQQKKQKETLLKQFSTAQQRMQLLNQIVLEEILYRKARKDKLTDLPKIRAILRDTERKILAQQVLQKEMTDEIKITPGDLQTYYQANKHKFMEPEQVKISHILVKDEETAKSALNGLEKNSKNFTALSKELSLDKATKDKGGEIDSWITRGGFIPGIGHSEEAAQVIFGTEVGQVAKKTVKSDKGVHIIKVREKKTKQQKSFEQAQSEVYMDLRRQKETEVQQSLMTELKERYNVVIHSSKFQTQPPQGDPHAGAHP